MHLIQEKELQEVNRVGIDVEKALEDIKNKHELLKLLLSKSLQSCISLVIKTQ